MIDYLKKNLNLDMKNLLYIIKIVNCGGNVLFIFIKNILCDFMEILLFGENCRGFNYGEDEYDRMKKYFYVEWVIWFFVIFFNYDVLIYLFEYVGKNRFYFILFLNNDEVLWNVGVSIGGGNFY